MTILRKPGLGPLVGHTTDTTSRVWIRAGDPADAKADLDENRRTIGVIGMVEGNPPTIGKAWYFRLQREYDRTGTFVLGSDVQLGYFRYDYEAQGKSTPRRLPEAVSAVTLKADTEYKVRVATLTIDDPMANDASLPDWQLIKRLPDIEYIKNELLELEEDACEAVFRTFPKPGNAAAKMSFLLGSCRYPGLLWKIKEADIIFGPMLKHYRKAPQLGEPVRFTMMCGDQIYADMLNRMVPILRADTYAEFQERYCTAYSAPNLHELLRSSTTYMILDDHEIEDNWTQDRINDPGKHQLFNVAISAYQSYQWSHGPRTWGRLLYYKFECAGYPVFVLDTRTQRYKDDLPGLRDNHLLGRPTLDEVNHPGQLVKLLNWLSEQQEECGDAPKFIVTSSVFVPNAVTERIKPTGNGEATAGFPAQDEVHDTDDQLYGEGWNRERREKSDSWPAYPNTRLAVLQHIVKNRIQNVVFLAGDIHCSNTAIIEFEGIDGKPSKDAKDLKAFSITSSAFYWPFPFADGDPNNYVHNSRDPKQSDPFPIIDTDAVMHYRSFGYTQEDNFTRLDIDRKAATLTVRVYNRKGELVEVDAPNGKSTKKNVLKLAKWT